MYKIDAEDKMQWINIVSIPHMDKNDASGIINNYKRIQEDIDIDTEGGDYSDIEKLKKTLN